jgi:hypothetical protein
MKERVDLDFFINTLYKVFPWIDDIKTREKKVYYASNELAGKEAIVDVIQLYFNYDNPEYIKNRGKSLAGKELKNKFYDFLGRYFDNDPRKYASLIDLEFFEVGPKKF